MSDKDTLNAKRVRTWHRRLMALMTVSLTLIAVLAFTGHPSGWVAVLTSLICAEATRRIMAEQYPERAMSWPQILSYAFMMDRASKSDDGQANNGQDDKEG